MIVMAFFIVRLFSLFTKSMDEYNDDYINDDEVCDVLCPYYIVVGGQHGC